MREKADSVTMNLYTKSLFSVFGNPRFCTYALIAFASVNSCLGAEDVVCDLKECKISSLQIGKSTPENAYDLFGRPSSSYQNQGAELLEIFYPKRGFYLDFNKGILSKIDLYLSSTGNHSVDGSSYMSGYTPYAGQIVYGEKKIPLETRISHLAEVMGKPDELQVRELRDDTFAFWNKEKIRFWARAQIGSGFLFELEFGIFEKK